MTGSHQVKTWPGHRGSVVSPTELANITIQKMILWNQVLCPGNVDPSGHTTSVDSLEARTEQPARQSWSAEHHRPVTTKRYVGDQSGLLPVDLGDLCQQLHRFESYRIRLVRNLVSTGVDPQFTHSGCFCGVPFAKWLVGDATKTARAQQWKATSGPPWRVPGRPKRPIH